MTSNSYTSSLLPRCRRSQRRLTTPSARHICSRVISGFFFPQPIRVFGGEPHGYQAQAQVPHQRLVAPPLEIGEAQLRFGHAETVFHVPAAEGHSNQRLDLGVRWGIGQEELLLAGFVITRPDQPVGPRRPTRFAVQPDPRRLDPPDLVGHGLPSQTNYLPALPAEQAGGADHFFRRPAFDLLVGPVALAVDCQSGQRSWHLADETQLPLVQPSQETGTAAVALVEGQPVEHDAVALGAVD